MPSNLECLLFLSWQSDRRDCRNFVTSVVEKLPDKAADIASVILDRDTVNVPGSPDIGDTIFEKIDSCDLFIADITLINDKDSGYRRTPNPNVMIELGYAIKTLGWERILLLQCIDYGDIEELPFDINHRRIANFTLGKDAESEEEKIGKKTESKKQIIVKACETIKLLRDKNLLFGGKRERAPKFEITFLGYGGIMAEIMLKIKNVSSKIVLNLDSHDLTVKFNDGTLKILDCKPRFRSSSIITGEETVIDLHNPMLGAGPGYNNYAWHNIVLKLQFSCEDEEGNIYWYEMARFIENAEKPDTSGIWPVKFIG